MNSGIVGDNIWFSMELKYLPIDVAAILSQFPPPFLLKRYSVINRFGCYELNGVAFIGPILIT
jgi:hypothetical protein